MSAEDLSKIKLPDTIGDKEVTVEIGVGHDPDHSVLDRLADTTDVKQGRKIHVSIDELSENLERIKTGSLSRMTIHEFAGSDFLDGRATKIYIFNVFGESYSSASIFGFNQPLLEGLRKKLRPGGNIIIGEHISPHAARFLRDVDRLKKMGFKTELYDSPIAIEALLTKKFGFSDTYARAFIGQSEENKAWRGPEHAGFLLLLTKP